MSKGASGRTVAYAVGDMLLATAAMAVAFWLRFVIFPGVNPVGGFRYHMLWAALFSPAYVILYGLLGVYDIEPRRGYVHAYGAAVAANTLGVMLYIDLVFVFQVVDFSRWMILFYYLLLNLFSALRGFAAHRLVRRRLREGRGLRRLVIIGGGTAARECCRRIAADPWAGYAVLGSVGESALETLPLLGDYDRLSAVLEESAPDEIIIATDGSHSQRLGEILRVCENSGVKLSLLPPSYEYMSAHPYMETVAGLPLINIRRVALDNRSLEVIKRLGDIVLSLALIAVTSPIMLLAAVATRLSSPGPVIFTQERIGKDRRPFRMLKFRSMSVNADSDTAWTVAGDPRRTWWGAFMRRYSIDELPQLFNVLIGDMSLVGPRPEIPLYVDHFKYSIPLYMVRHQVRPGITGWAQVNGLRGNTSIQARVDYDLYYIENWSLFFDLKILLMTPFKGLVNRQEPLKKTGEKRRRT